jgi:hypothetical protein
VKRITFPKGRRGKAMGFTSFNLSYGLSALILQQKFARRFK